MKKWNCHRAIQACPDVSKKENKEIEVLSSSNSRDGSNRNNFMIWSRIWSCMTAFWDHFWWRRRNNFRKPTDPVSSCVSEVKLSYLIISTSAFVLHRHLFNYWEHTCCHLLQWSDWSYLHVKNKAWHKKKPPSRCQTVSSATVTVCRAPTGFNFGCSHCNCESFNSPIVFSTLMIVLFKIPF